MSTNPLYIVGVGPGDPELLTLKAARIIRQASTIAYFAKHNKKGHARTIADPFIAPTTKEIRLEYPYTTEISFSDPRYINALNAFYTLSAQRLSECLNNSKSHNETLVLLSEGDPFLYGSCLCVFDRLAPFHKIEVIPGISSFSASWSAALKPISQGDDVLSVIPGTLPFQDLCHKLLLCDAAVILKVGQNLKKVYEALLQTQKLENAFYVEYVTQTQQQIIPLAQECPKQAPYFSLIIIPGRKNNRNQK